MITINSQLDMTPGAIPVVIHRSQYDSDFSIVFTLFARTGNFTIASGTTAKVRGTKKSGTGYSADATIDISAKTVTVAGNQQMTVASGQNIFEIVLLSGTKELCSANFILNVERAALDMDTITDNTVARELDNLDQFVTEAGAAADRAETAAATFDVDATLTVSGAAADAKKTGDELAKKVDAVSGKGLSTNDFTTTEKDKLSGIESGANKTVIDSTLAVSGNAADAKSVGNEIDSLKSALIDISGSTRNLFAGNYVVGFIDGATFKLATNANGVVAYIPCTGGKTYTVSKTAGARFAVATTTSLPVVGNSVSDYSANNTASSITITASSSAQYLVAWVWLGTADTTITKAQMLASVQIEEGSVATDYVQHLTAIDLIARQNAGLSVVADSSDLAETYTPYVMVMNNNSAYGDGGTCLFSTRTGETAHGYTREDGSVVYPMPDQSNLPPTNAPKELLDIIGTYVGNSSLTYGNTSTMYNSTCTNEIDCSTFVTAVMNRIPYAKSRYALGTSNANILGYDVGDTLLNYSASTGWSRLITHQMAQWFAEHKRLFTIPTGTRKACDVLQFGDILFSASGSYRTQYYGIDHCAIVLGTIPSSEKIVIAQCGTFPSRATYNDNESTVGKISMINMDSTTIGTNFFVYARPDYGGANVKDDFSLMNFVINDAYQFEPYFLLNYYVAPTTGAISYSKTYSGTPIRIEVLPGRTIKYTGAAQDSDGNVDYAVYCIEYDKDDKFVKYTNLQNGDASLASNTKYVRFSFGHTAQQNASMTLAKLADFKAIIV